MGAEGANGLGGGQGPGQARGAVADDAKRGSAAIVARTGGKHPGNEAFYRLANLSKWSIEQRGAFSDLIRALREEARTEAKNLIDRGLEKWAGMVDSLLTANLGPKLAAMSEELKREMLEMRRSFGVKRVEFPSDVKDAHENFARQRRSGAGTCYCCGSALFGAGGKRLPEVEFDHQDGNRQNNSEWNCWLICEACHVRKTNPESEDERDHFLDFFRAYRRDFKAWQSSVSPPQEQRTLAQMFDPGRPSRRR